MKRALCTAAAIAGFVGFAAPSAQAAEYVSGPVVTYHVGTDYVSVGTGLPGQPLAGARYSFQTGEGCVGFSYQVPQCVQVGPIEVSPLP